MVEKLDRFTSAEVLDLVRTALTAPTAGRSALRARLAHARELQRGFRSEPVGGKLAGLKKLVYWFTASSFDRQAKAVEALLELADDLVDEVEKAAMLRSASPGAAAVPWPDAGTAPAATVAGEGSPRSLAAVLDVDAEMLRPEKVLLYGLIFGLKPRRCLEIGTFRGGSAAVICAAMDDNGFGELVCVDPEPRIPPHVEERIAPRATIIKGGSPEVLAQARLAAGGELDFALIDGDHTKDGVRRDVEGALEHVAEGGYLLFHDCHFFEVAEAIDEALARHPRKLMDCGVLSTARNPVEGEGSHVGGRRVVWGGLRLLRRIGG